jgi:phage portal protein BeeE
MIFKRNVWITEKYFFNENKKIFHPEQSRRIKTKKFLKSFFRNFFRTLARPTEATSKNKCHVSANRRPRRSSTHIYDTNYLSFSKH